MKEYIESIVLFFKDYPAYAIGFFCGGYLIGVFYF